MSEPKYGVVAVGNALVDVLVQVDDNFLDEQARSSGMEKGAMTLIDEKRAVALYKDMHDAFENLVLTSGGSAANTMAGFASLGGKGAFIGKVADDDLGLVFKDEIKNQGIEFTTQPLAVGAQTGRCMILVSDDAERTMNTFLGASVELDELDVDEELVGQALVTYLEGYLFDRDQAKRAFIRAAELAHKYGHRVALTLSDPFCVDRHREDFASLVENHIDILFANEEEIKSLYMTEDFDEAISKVSGHCEVAVITRNAKGAVVLHKGETITIAAEKVDNVVDSTGAGDQFAAGFLCGFTQGYPMERCGRLGAISAAEVISHMGPRPEVSLSDLVKQKAV